MGFFFFGKEKPDGTVKIIKTNDTEAAAAAKKDGKTVISVSEVSKESFDKAEALLKKAGIFRKPE